ncbi:MAG: hypothetical protein PHU34_04400 [Candidatus Methanoperedens sp.]|nr:hypothetical protein [Candidatus Methanoperedens sp.]
MKIGQLIFIIVIVLFVVIVINKTSTPAPKVSTPEVYEPKPYFEVSPTAINVTDNQFSGIIEINVTKLDDMKVPTNFTLKFISSNPEYVYPVDAKSYQKIYERGTGNLTLKDSKDIYDFIVFGKKMSGQDYSPWNINIELYYNNTKINERRLNVTVR